MQVKTKNQKDGGQLRRMRACSSMRDRSHSDDTYVVILEILKQR